MKHHIFKSVFNLHSYHMYVIYNDMICLIMHIHCMCNHPLAPMYKCGGHGVQWMVWSVHVLAVCMVVCGTWSPIESAHASAGGVVSGDYVNVDITSHSPS